MFCKKSLDPEIFWFEPCNLSSSLSDEKKKAVKIIWRQKTSKWWIPWSERVREREARERWEWDG